MANVTEARTLVLSAESIEEYMNADAKLRRLESAPEYPELLASLNARSAPAMLAIKAEMDQSGLSPRFAQQAMVLRAAGYPEGDSEFTARRNRILTDPHFNADQMVDEVLADPALNDDEQNKLLRLIDARKRPVRDWQFEANWTDIRMTPAGRMAVERLERKREEVAAFDGSAMFKYLRDVVKNAEKSRVLDVISEEVHESVDSQEASLLRTLIRIRKAELAGTALAHIVDEHGWQVVRALHEGRDLFHRLGDGESVQEFLTLMRSVKAPVDQIREVDAKLADRVAREVWGRSEERLHERKQVSEAQRRLEERLREIE